MKRNYKHSKTDIDLSVPVNIADFKSADDCFGNMFDMATNECRLCADCSLCSIVFDKTVLSEMRTKTDNEKGPFTDTYKFTSIKDSGLVDKLKSNPNMYTRQDLFNVVEKLSECDMPDMVNDYIESMMIQHGFKEQNGLICLK